MPNQAIAMKTPPDESTANWNNEFEAWSEQFEALKKKAQQQEPLAVVTPKKAPSVPPPAPSAPPVQRSKEEQRFYDMEQALRAAAPLACNSTMFESALAAAKLGVPLYEIASKLATIDLSMRAADSAALKLERNLRDRARQDGRVGKGTLRREKKRNEPVFDPDLVKTNEIAAMRADLNMTQNDFGALVGVLFTTVSRWERGATQPSARQMEDIRAKVKEWKDAGG